MRFNKKTGEVQSYLGAVMTDKILKLTVEWFMGNKHVMASFVCENGQRPALFYTDDKDKRDRILEILGEDRDDI